MLVSPREGRRALSIPAAGTGALLVFGRHRPSTPAEITMQPSQEGRNALARPPSARGRVSPVSPELFVYFHSYCFIRCPPGSERQSRPGDRDGDRLGTCLSGISDSFLLVTKSQGQVYFVDKSAYTEPKILQTGKRPVL